MAAQSEKINANTSTSTIGVRIDQNIFFVAAIIFIAEQALEFLVISVYQHNYSDLCAWDCGWYKSIVEHGYDIEPHGHSKGDAANWAFFPALPFIAKALFHIFGLSAASSLVLTGKVFFLLSIFWFIKFVRVYNPVVPAWLSGMIVAFSPYAIYGNVGYTEPVFLFWTCSFFYFLKQKEYVKSGLCGAVLTSARVAGLFAIFSYLVSTVKRFYSNPETRLDIMLGVLLIPLGLACFMLLLYVLVGDSLAFSHIQRAWGRNPQNPLWIISKGLHGSAFDVYSTATALAAIFLSLVLIGQRRYELAVFSLTCSVVPLSTGLWSLTRYVWWQAPLLLLVAELVQRTRSWLLMIPVSVAGLLFMYFSWFTGKDFVI
jgi:hypothetical protein